MARQLFTSALFAGLAAGLIAALLQLGFVVPIIQEAELYETGQRVHFGAAAPEELIAAPVGDTDGAETPARGTGGFDWQRNMLTLAMNLIAYTAFALLLLPAIILAERRGLRQGWRGGLAWGAAGFAVFALAPAAGLPPELPGSVAAEVAPRQIWWAFTALTTAGALALIMLGRGGRAAVAGAALLLLPHFIGAPEPFGYGGTAPPELAALFAGRSLAVAAVSWMVLGTMACFLWARRSP